MIGFGLLERTASDLAARGWAVVPAFLEPGAVCALRAAAQRMQREGRLRPAAVGQGGQRALRPEVRGDRIAWLDAADPDPAWRAYLERMEDLRLQLNGCAYLGLLAFETHVALYPPKASYARHRDRFAQDARRVLSTVLYLNEDWGPDDGGALRLHVEGEPHDIEPIGGTLVAFRSALEHEVLPARRERWSLTGWFTRRT